MGTQKRTTIQTKNSAAGSFMTLPNVKDEPRLWLARLLRSRRRDRHGRWLWRLVRPILLLRKINDRKYREEISLRSSKRRDDPDLRLRVGINHLSRQGKLLLENQDANRSYRNQND